MQYKMLSGYASDHSDELLQKRVQLSDLVWPENEDPKYELTSLDERPNRYIAAIECDGKLVSEAEGFGRIIGHKKGTLEVLALASVCTDPDYRHRGFASMLVKEIFKLVDNGQYPLSVWQTGVPDFYLKLGASLVTNNFYNSLHPTIPNKVPFWEKYKMIYPGNCKNWPQGDIDTLGLGF